MKSDKFAAEIQLAMGGFVITTDFNPPDTEIG
jgi:hypothetical protein